jgi:putative iron-dependent peroxidase
MPTPQHGIFALGTRSHHHLELDVPADVDPAALLGALAALREAATTVAGVNVVVGFGAALAARVAPDAVPAQLAAFETIRGADGFTYSPGQHDLWLWLHASGPDATFDLARAAVVALDGLATLAAEQASFTYQASRDLTGFEDGTENPSIDEAAAVCTVPAGQPGEGSSVVLLQRWVHDLVAFELLGPDDQDQVIGRTKAGSEELDDEHRSPQSHISRVVIEDDQGEELEVFRRSTAFGTVGEHGLVFLAFSADVDRLDRMLRNMAGTDDGIRDRLTDFSTPTASAWYVAPPLETFLP